MPVSVTDAERAAIQAYYDRTGDAEADFKKQSAAKNVTSQSLNDIWKLMRAAGVLGKTEAMLQAAANGRTKLALTSTMPEAHEAHRRLIGWMRMDMGRPGFAADDLQRHLPNGTAGPGLQNTVARLSRAKAQLNPLFTPINRFLEGHDDLEPLETADLGLIAPLHVLSRGGDGPTELPSTLLTMLTTTFDMAKAAGLTVCLIPDFLFASLRQRPSHIFSFHTAGQFPGFVHFQKADLPNYIMIDKAGYSAWSSLSGSSLKSLERPTLAKSRTICERLFADGVTANVSKYPQPDAGDIEGSLPARYVFVALQGPMIDAREKVRFDTKAMLKMVINRFKGTDVAVVVKPHPKMVQPDMIGWLIGEAEAGSIVLREDSIHTLAAGSEAVLTINSRVGSEVMIHRKPVYCFGGSDYDAIAHKITSAEQFRDLTTPIRPAVTDNDLLRFIAFYRTKYLVDRQEPGRLESALQERVIDPILRQRG